MTRTPNQIKNMITDWMVQERKNCIDITENEDNPAMEFVLRIDTQNYHMYVYLNKKFPKKIMIDSPIIFSSKHITIIEKMDNVARWGFILKLDDRIAAWGLNSHYVQEGKKISALTLHDFIDVDEFSRATFTHSISTNRVRGIHMSKIIGYYLNTMEQPSTNIDNNSEDGPYR